MMSMATLMYACTCSFHAQSTTLPASPTFLNVCVYVCVRVCRTCACHKLPDALMVLYCRSPRRLPQCTTIPGTVVEHIDLSDNQLSGSRSTQLGSFARLLYVHMRASLVTTLFTVADWWQCLLVSTAFSRITQIS